jgi:hypothetical protein
MGYGSYSADNRTANAVTHGYFTKSSSEIFTNTTVSQEMDVKSIGAGVRESRDSKEHPDSVPVIIALDVTGSMGTVPHHLVKDGLPTMVVSIINGGVPDPQVLFLAVGDHTCDSVPLQAAQFESNDELLDKWLTQVYIEGHGGGNNGESYMLAWYFAAFHTATDRWEKRKKKGILFTIGDEPVLDNLPVSALKKIMGTDDVGQGKHSFSSLELLEAARETYEVYHLHIMQGYNGKRQDVMDGWKQIMGDNLVTVQDYNQVSEVMSQIVNNVAANGASKPTAKKPEESGETEEIL